MTGQKIKRIVSLSLLLVVFLPVKLPAVVGFQVGCTDQFIGIVTTVTDSRAPLNHLEKITVKLNVIEVLSGSQGSEREFETLKYGPQQFVVGETYQISMREHWICGAEKIK